MDLVKIAEWLSQNASSVMLAGLALLAVFAVLSSSVWRRAAKSIEQAFFTNWRLALLGATGIVLSIASGWTTWDGMRNFTGEPLLSFMVTFGIQGVMLIVAWLIGETFAAGMNQQSSAGLTANKAVAGAILGLSLAAALSYLALQGRFLDANHLIFIGIGVALIALIGVLQSDLLKPYTQSLRIVTRSAVLWLMFLACMATSVFFSFDSLFSTIFPASERQRAAELRAQNQVSGILADINQTMSQRQLSEIDALFSSQGWAAYERQLTALAASAQGAQGEIENYFVQKMEERRRSIAQQQERMATANSRQAGLAIKKTSLSEELTRLGTERPGLATEYTQHKTELDAKAKEIDAKRVEAMAEERGVEGTGKVGRGQVYRERMSELTRLQDEYKIKQERTKDAEKRLATVQLRIEQIRRELAAIDGDLAQLKGEAETAKQRIDVAQTVGPEDQAQKVDPDRVLPAFERARGEFRQEPTAQKLAVLQQQCANLLGAMSATPATKEKVRGIDCDPKQASDAATTLFAINDGAAVFARQCAGGDKLAQNASTDALFGFARKCLSDSGLPSKDTDTLRTKINLAELNRDDKAHRFVVTWNAFGDGNRLAYLALAIAIAIDGLVFMSGLFGANAVRSPLSDVPSTKARSARQLEDMINAHLGEDHERYENAKILLHSLRPSSQPGFSLQIDLRRLTPIDAERVIPVLNAGSEIGAVAVRNEDHETYFVKGELAQYLASFVERMSAQQKAAPPQLSHQSILSELNKTIHIALLPDVGHNAEMVLSFMHPMREDRGFMAEVRLEEVQASDNETGRRDLRTVRNALNAGATFDRVQRVATEANHFYIHGDFYKTLVRLRARLISSAAYPPAIAGPQPSHGGQAVDITPKAPQLAKPDAPTTPQIAPPQRPTAGDKPQQQTAQQTAQAVQRVSDPARPRADQPDDTSNSDDLYLYFWSALVRALDIAPDLAVKRLAAVSTREQALATWQMLNALAAHNDQLGRLLDEHRTEQEEKLGQSYTVLRGAANNDQPTIDVLDIADSNIQDILPALMLFPENGLLTFLIESLERAAGPDDGQIDGEQELLDTLRHVRHNLAHADLAKEEIWQWVGEALRQLAPPAAEDDQDYPGIVRFTPNQRDQKS